MLIFFSGEENKAVPEIVLGKKANIMLTFLSIRKTNGKISKRFKRLLKVRRELRKRSRDPKDT